MAKIKIPKGNKGFGYVGVWGHPEQTLGWFIPPHIVGHTDRKYPEITREKCAEGERFFLCEITVKPEKDKLGRPITKIIPKSQP